MFIACTAEISSSGLGSDSDGSSSEAEGDKEELAEAFQGLTPEDDSPGLFCSPLNVILIEVAVIVEGKENSIS